jgi:hypothetical protein
MSDIALSTRQKGVFYEKENVKREGLDKIGLSRR